MAKVLFPGALSRATAATNPCGLSQFADVNLSELAANVPLSTSLPACTGLAACEAPEVLCLASLTN